MKVTADTNFFISSIQWDNSVAHKLLRKLLKTNAEIFTTKEILDEFATVLQRNFKYSEEEINNILEKITPFIAIIEPKEKLDIIKDDPDDNKILECAVASKSEYIITYDNHLLSLKEFRGIKIVKPEKLV
ncbi:MAG: putative toxin-antitoxin system toxin component, PIN family [Nanoarchaeota archaeon]